MKRRDVGFFEPRPRGGAVLLILAALLATVVGGTRASSPTAPAPAEAPATHETKGSQEPKGSQEAPAPAHAAPAAHEGGKASPAAPASPVKAAAEPTEWGLSSSEALWADLLEGNRRFQAGRPDPREYLMTRSRLASGQHPPVMVLGCADSRVSPELVFDKNLGDLFVVRTAGNIADAIALGSLEYAAEHLHTRLLIVLGHEKCGAVAAACSGQTLPSPNLQALVERIAPAVARTAAYTQHKPITLSEVELNAEASAEYIVRNSPILAHAVKSGELAIIPAVYHFDTGEVTRIDGDFSWLDTPEH